MKKNVRNETSGSLKSRRDFFKTTGQVVAVSALTGGTFPYVSATENDSPDDAPVERSDAAMIGPRDNIKVTRIETFVLRNSWVFVKISTDAGITGWGEMLKDDAKACAAGALEVGNYLVGKDPLRVVHHWQAIHRGSFYRGGPIKTAILSGIDQALWDITGKAFGVPVYRLLGGPTRDRIRVYGTLDPKTGVNAIKVGPDGGQRQPVKYIEGQKFVDLLAKPMPQIKDGYRPLLTDPGLGITIDEDKLRAQVGEPTPYNTRFDPDDGSVVDW